ncbi:hypothetical protein F5890DRAFT_1558948 [Lentinula detonsa]|uniref:Uncharacterized protein n=1 Tax=Lentinula detonsa TaxID=2804962 RepID=A0AA38UML2_9AGAR|nr:hypothetical protein F5890DRAFT_1558948 [Lentinula detonsa]
MSSNNTETAQQCRERLLAAQAECQRLRDEEIARQEAEFAAEMERLEEEAAREEEEKRVIEEQRVAEEKRIEEEQRLKEEKRVAEEKRAEEKRIAEKKLAEERELAEAMRLEAERIAELKRFEEEVLNEEKRVAEEEKQEKNRITEAKRREEEQLAEAEDAREQNTAFAKMIEENKKEKDKAARELKKRRERTVPTTTRKVEVVVRSQPSGSKAKSYKWKSVISDDSDEAGADRDVDEAPRGTKRKRTTKMIARDVDTPDPIADVNAEDEDDEEPPSPSQSHSVCTRCVLLGKPGSCHPQTTRRKTQACELCHVQRQWCSWISDHASRRSRGKRAKLEDDIYRGPAAGVTERKFAGPEIAEHLAVLAGQNAELVGIARRSLEVQERVLSIMERREQRKLEKREVGGREEDEDEDGEGEEDEEVEETRRRGEICEGKKRAE